MGKSKKRPKKVAQGVLSDHKKVGKKLVPPMMQIAGGMSPTHYDRDTLPELIWLALVEKVHGMHAAADTAAKVGKYVSNCRSSCRFITLSEMYSAEKEEWISLRAYLATSGVLPTLLSALHDFVVLYPECPIGNLFERRPADLRDENFLVQFEELLEDLMYKRGRRAVLMQANAIYLLGCQGKLFVKQGLSLGNLDELRNYPNTEESQMVGASVCAASSMVIMAIKGHAKPTRNWPEYFWKRNLQLRPITPFFTDEI